MIEPKTISNPELQAPWWARNTHVQTIASSLLSKAYKPEVKRVEIPTPDGDFLEIDLALTESSQTVTVLFHGLEGSSERYYITNLMDTLLREKSSVVAVNFRGCGYKTNKQPYYYNAGATYDYETVFKWVKEELNPNHLYAAGFSLGANALIKYMGEQGNASLITKGVAISPPFDLKGGAVGLQKGFNQIYEKYFLSTLTKKLEIKKELFPDMPSFNGTSLYDFDDQVTAVLHNYNGAEDYYESCSSKNFFQDIRKPLLLIHSMSDSICPFKFAPLDVIHSNSHITPCFSKHGGHVGFWSTKKNWLNDLVVDWLID